MLINALKVLVYKLFLKAFYERMIKAVNISNSILYFLQKWC